MAIYCNDPVPGYVADICANDPTRIIAVAYIREDNATLNGYTSANEWINGVANGTIHVITNVRGEKPKGSPITKDGFGKQKTYNTGRDFSITYEHPDVVGNEDFYNAMNYQNSWRIAFYTSGGKLFVSENVAVNIDADYVIAPTLDDVIIWNVAVTWSAQAMPVAYNGPASVFEP